MLCILLLYFWALLGPSSPFQLVRITRSWGLQPCMDAVQVARLPQCCAPTPVLPCAPAAAAAAWRLSISCRSHSGMRFGGPPAAAPAGPCAAAMAPPAAPAIAAIGSDVGSRCMGGYKFGHQENGALWHMMVCRILVIPSERGKVVVPVRCHNARSGRHDGAKMLHNAWAYPCGLGRSRLLLQRALRGAGDAGRQAGSRPQQRGRPRRVPWGSPRQPAQGRTGRALGPASRGQVVVVWRGQRRSSLLVGLAPRDELIRKHTGKVRPLSPPCQLLPH